MKTKVLFLSIVMCFTFGMKVSAQKFVSSTEADPVWQYIQLVGTGSRAGLVMTAEEGVVFGRKMYNGLDSSIKNTQLWRIEKATTTSYSIINKATGKKLDVVYDTSLKIRKAVLADNASTTNWRFQMKSNNYTIRMMTEPEEGVAGSIYAHITTSISRKNVIMFGASSVTDESNGRFVFITAGVSPEESKDNNEIWYFIKSAKTGNANKCITAIENPTESVVFSVSDKNVADDNQYWKFVLTSNSTQQANGIYAYQIVNKGTGTTISSEVILDRYFYAQAATENDSIAWGLNLLGNGQFEIVSVGAEVDKYLSATTSGDDSYYYSGSSLDSSFAWTFEWAQGTGLSVPENVIDFGVYSESKRIYVVGAEDYTVRNIYGSIVNKTNALDSGIYFVTVGGVTKKVLVK
ncbi:hypothetical protein M2138_000620 [Dysgonomonadaceae bacterium PH5-43]|nr:hypothetical protein [Dysgonomonadaceae bacterium PH5-43]